VPGKKKELIFNAYELWSYGNIACAVQCGGSGGGSELGSWYELY
jgi:hypothetical protein